MLLSPGAGKAETEAIIPRINTWDSHALENNCVRNEKELILQP